MTLSQDDKVKLVDDLIKQNPDATVRDYIVELKEIENEVAAIRAAKDNINELKNK